MRTLPLFAVHPGKRSNNVYQRNTKARVSRVGDVMGLNLLNSQAIFANLPNVGWTRQLREIPEGFTQSRIHEYTTARVQKHRNFLETGN